MEKLLTKFKKEDRFYFTTLSGSEAIMLGYVRFIDEQSLNELYEDLLNFYGCKNNDFVLAFSQQSGNFILDFAIAKDCKSGKIFSFKE